MTDRAIQSVPEQDIIESVMVQGDLSKLTPPQRVSYYRSVCNSLGLNPLTKPFDYIQLSGKLTLYAKRDAADQLRRINGVSITKLERETVNGVYCVTAYAQDRDGRQDSSIGAVNIEKLSGDALANAYMKAETKAKRRVTLSLCGLGWLDETETSTIRDAQPVIVSVETGEIQPEPDPDNDAPNERAWKAWDFMVQKAEAKHIEVAEPAEDVTTGQLRQLYTDLKHQVEAANSATQGE